MSIQECAMVVLLALIGFGGPVMCSIHEDARVAEMVKHGKEPLDAACAIYTWGSNFGSRCNERAKHIQ